MEPDMLAAILAIEAEARSLVPAQEPTGEDIGAVLAMFGAVIQGHDGTIAWDVFAQELAFRLGARAASPAPSASGDLRDRWARWIVSQTRRTDWACRECVDADVRGQDNLVTPDFRCVWHEARAALSPSTPPTGAEE
jgi:hypothetical protein